MAIQLLDATIFDYIPVGVLIINKERKLTYCNEAFANILRTPLRRLKPGAPFSKTMPPQSEVFHVLDLEEGQHREMTMNLPSGHTPTVRINCQKIDYQGTEHFLLFILDISIEKHLHEKYKSLSQDSVRDDKTRLYNAGYFERSFHDEFAKQQNLGLTIIDIDRFKQVNDTYGHLAGDIVLKQVSDTIKSNLPKDAMAARYGGEEFCILLKEATEEKLMELSNKIRQKIEAAEMFLEKENKMIKVTVSSGASLQTAGIKTSRILFEKADEALYEAKNTGRNKSLFKA